jgi:hypothetical protein
MRLYGTAVRAMQRSQYGLLAIAAMADVTNLLQVTHNAPHNVTMGHLFRWR